VGTDLILWYTPWRSVRYLFLLYGWYLVPVLLLLGIYRFLVPSLCLFLFALLPALYGAFRLQCRFFGSRPVRRALQMRFRVPDRDS
jgi:hypothetical protein